jgi:hypothetical protein
MRMLLAVRFRNTVPMPHAYHTAKTQYRKFEINIPRKGIPRPKAQIPHSYVCERFIYSHDRSAYVAAGKYVDRSWELKNHSQTHEYRKWELRPRKSFSGNTEMGFSLQCRVPVTVLILNIPKCQTNCTKCIPNILKRQQRPRDVFDLYREGGIPKYLCLLEPVFATTAAVLIEIQTYKTILNHRRSKGMTESHPKTFSICVTYRFYICGKDLFAVEPVLLPACDPDQVSRHQGNAGLVRARGPAPY